VDAVFVNSKGNTVVVELKTGFEGYNETSTGKMRGVFSNLTDCLANQHKVQLALTSAMFGAGNRRRRRERTEWREEDWWITKYAFGYKETLVLFTKSWPVLVSEVSVAFT
jgi:hypothetical protein